MLIVGKFIYNIATCVKLLILFDITNNNNFRMNEMNNKQGYILGILSGVSVLLSNTWAAQPMSESALATQTGAINASLPVIIAKAQDDAKNLR